MSKNSYKKIAVTVRYINDPDYSIPVQGIPESYSRSLFKIGAVPFLVPIYNSSENTNSLSRQEYINFVANECDGLILTGGEDIDPSLYNEKNHPKLGKVSIERDKFEIDLFKAFLNSGKKILGVCRGQQLVNVALGGTLIQDIPSLVISDITHTTPDDKWFSIAHDVYASSDKFLSIFKSDSIKVNSIHHQSIDKLAEPLEVIGKSKDNVIEACVLKNQVLTVQWHPETMWDAPLDETVQLRLFEWLCS